jgi:hypothetical protein
MNVGIAKLNRTKKFIWHANVSPGLAMPRPKARGGCPASSGNSHVDQASVSRLTCVEASRAVLSVQGGLGHGKPGCTSSVLRLLSSGSFFVCDFQVQARTGSHGFARARGEPSDNLCSQRAEGGLPLARAQSAITHNPSTQPHPCRRSCPTHRPRRGQNENC